MARVTLPALPVNGNIVDAVQADAIWNALLAGVNAVDQTQLVAGAVAIALGPANSLTQIGWFSVKDPVYGAKGDGVTDDYPAFLAASTAAGAGGCISVPLGTYRLSRPFVPQFAGQWLRGMGRTSDDNPDTPATVLLCNVSTDIANYYGKGLIDYLPGASTGQEVTVAQTDFLRVSDLTVDAQARLLTGAYATGNYASGIRLGEGWILENVHLRDGHYFHGFIAGQNCEIRFCEFSEGDAYQDTLGGSSSGQHIHHNTWTSNCSYNATLNGADHNAIDMVGSLSRFRTGSGQAPSFNKIHHNRILGMQVIVIESWKDFECSNNLFATNGSISMQSNGRYGYTTFDNVERGIVAYNVFFGTGATAGTVILLQYEVPMSPNTGSQTKGGAVSIIGNKIFNCYQVAILVGGATATTAYGGDKINSNTIINPNANAGVNVSPGGLGYSATATIAAINVVTGYLDLQVNENTIIDNRGTPKMQVGINFGQSTSTTPVGPCRARGNDITGVNFGAGFIIQQQNLVSSPLASGVTNLPNLDDNQGWPPGQAVAPTLTLSSTIQNALGRTVEVYLSSNGATVSTVSVNGVSILSASTTQALISYRLAPGETTLVAASGGTPTWKWFYVS